MGRCGCIGCSRPLVLIIIERIIDKRLIKNINLHRHQVFFHPPIHSRYSSHNWREFFLPAISGNKQVLFRQANDRALNPFWVSRISTTKMPDTLESTQMKKKEINFSPLPTYNNSTYFVNSVIVHGKNRQTPPPQRSI